MATENAEHFACSVVNIRIGDASLKNITISACRICRTCEYERSLMQKVVK